MPPRPWHDWGESDAEIAAFEDDPDALRLTITVSLVVRVTREKVLDRFAREVFAARREVLDAADFAPLACDPVQERAGRFRGPGLDRHRR